MTIEQRDSLGKVLKTDKVTFGVTPPISTRILHPVAGALTFLLIPPKVQANFLVGVFTMHKEVYQLMGHTGVYLQLIPFTLSSSTATDVPNDAAAAAAAADNTNNNGAVKTMPPVVCSCHTYHLYTDPLTGNLQSPDALFMVEDVTGMDAGTTTNDDHQYFGKLPPKVSNQVMEGTVGYQFTDSDVKTRTQSLLPYTRRIEPASTTAMTNVRDNFVVVPVTPEQGHAGITKTLTLHDPMLTTASATASTTTGQNLTIKNPRRNTSGGPNRTKLIVKGAFGDDVAPKPLLEGDTLTLHAYQNVWQIICQCSSSM